MADAVDKVVDLGEDVMLDALEIILGGFIGHTVIDILPVNLPVPRDVAVLGLGLGVAAFVKGNRTVRNLGYGMAVSGAMSLLQPYIVSVLSKTVSVIKG